MASLKTNVENDENASPFGNLGNRNFGSGGKGSLRKSLIPKPVTSPTNDENSPAFRDQIQKKTRRPLSLVQNADSPSAMRRPSDPAAVCNPRKESLRSSKGTARTRTSGVKQAATSNASKTSLKDGATVTSPVNKLCLSSGVPKTPQNSPSKAKLRGKKQEADKTTNTQKSANENQDVENEGESLAYWKELCESRRLALEEALKENYELHQRNQELQKQNSELEALVEEAKELATMLNEAADELELDESGIGVGESEAVGKNETDKKEEENLDDLLAFL